MFSPRPSVFCSAFPYVLLATLHNLPLYLTHTHIHGGAVRHVARNVSPTTRLWDVGCGMENRWGEPVSQLLSRQSCHVKEKKNFGSVGHEGPGQGRPGGGEDLVELCFFPIQAVS